MSSFDSFLRGLFYVVVTLGILTGGFIWWGFHKLEETAECENRMLYSVESPAQRRIVYVYVVECIATVPYFTQINVQPFGTSLDLDKYRPFFSVRNLPDLKTRWIKEEELEVSGLIDGEIFRRETTSGDIQIRYQFNGDHLP